MNNQVSVSSGSSFIKPGGVHRPKWLCSLARQNVGLVRDASPSMAGQKAVDASAACLALIREAANPANKDGFRITVVDFDGTACTVHTTEKASVLADNAAPICVRGSGTNITAGLEMMFGLLEADAVATADDEVTHLKPVVFCFTDGCHNVGRQPYDIANRMKQKVDLVTVAFGDDADETLMRALASTPQHFYRCADGSELRQFLAKAGATLSATLAARVNATNALAHH